MAENAMVPCVVCGTTLENVDRDAENQPYGGTSFSTSGHYGSTAFDPMNGSMLELNLCDPCLKRASAQGRVLWRREAKALVGAPPWPTAIFGWLEESGPYTFWKPDEEAAEGPSEGIPWYELERHVVRSREELLELCEQRGLRLYGGVKLNGGFTPETAWPEEDANE